MTRYIESPFGRLIRSFTSKRQPAREHWRTLTPSGATIVLAPSGFTVLHESERIADVQWNDVQMIFAYTRFMDGSGTLCLDFVLPADERGEEQRVVVNESVEGWLSLVANLEGVFPSLDKKWTGKARCGQIGVERVAPRFVANCTLVWPR